MHLIYARFWHSKVPVKVQQDSDQQYRQELERQILATYGIGGYNQTDLIGMWYVIFWPIPPFPKSNVICGSQIWLKCSCVLRVVV